MDHLTLPGAVADVWRVRWRRDDGTHRGTTVGSRDQAEAVFRQWIDGLEDGVRYDPMVAP